MTISPKAICLAIAAVVCAVVLGLLGKKAREGGWIAGQTEMLKKHIQVIRKQQRLRQTPKTFNEDEKAAPGVMPKDEAVDDVIRKIDEL